MPYGTFGCAGSEHGLAGGFRLAAEHRGGWHPRWRQVARTGRPLPDRGRPRADPPQAPSPSSLPPAAVHPAAGAGLAAVGRCPRLRHRRSRRSVPARCPGRRGGAAGGLRGAAAAAAGPVPPAVADVVPAGPGRGAGRPVHEGASCRRRRGGWGGRLRRVPRCQRRRVRSGPATMDTSPVGGVRRAWPAARETFAEGRAPKTSLNHPIGAGRTLALVRSRLDLVKGIAHAHHATVNDVLLTAVAGGLRSLLASRGECVGELVLRAFVPVSLRREQPGQARGNLDGAMIVPLPVGEPGHARRLQLIAADTAERKKKSRPPGSTFFRNAMIQRAFLRYATRQRLMNVYLANIPGPPVPL